MLFPWCIFRSIYIGSTERLVLIFWLGFLSMVTQIKWQKMLLYFGALPKSREVYCEILHISNHFSTKFIKPGHTEPGWKASVSHPKFATVSATRAWILLLRFCSPIIISLILSTLQTLSCEALIKWWIWQCSKIWEKLSKYKTLYTIIFIGCLLLSSLGNQQSFKRLRSQLCISMKNSTSRIARPFL